MNTLPDAFRFAGDADHTDAALLRALGDMQPGWVVFRDCLLADDLRSTWARVRYALLHPKIGIALLDVLPGATTPDACRRMRRLLDVSDFRLVFGDYPPIVYLCVPTRTLSEIAPLLAREFDVLPPLELARRDAWVAAAQSALAAAEQRLRVSGQIVDDRRSELTGLPRPERVGGWSAPRQAVGLRALGVFWGAVGVAFGGGALLLQYLGPPEPTAAIAHDGTGPEGARVALEEALPTRAMPATGRPSVPGPMLAIWPAERMRTRFDAASSEDVAKLEFGDAAAVGTRSDGDRFAPLDLIAATRPPRSQVAGARIDSLPASVQRVEHHNGSDHVLSTEATRPPPDLSEARSGEPETVSGSERAPAGGSAPPAAGTAAGAGTAHATGAAADDDPLAPVSGLGADAAAAAARDAGLDVPPLPDLGGIATPAQTSVPTGPPTDTLETPTVADVHGSQHADPESTREPDGLGSAGARLPPPTESEAAPRSSAPRETALGSKAPQAQESSQALIPPTADGRVADPAAASAAESASPRAKATADALPNAEPPVSPPTHAEPHHARVQPAETAGPTTATTAGVAASPTNPQPPSPSGAPPAAVAALLARGDALIAIGNIAAARLVYQRAAAHSYGRAATATGKTYDPRFLQAIGAIGVVADPDAAAAWYRKGSALGDDDATTLLDGLQMRASQ